MLGKAERFPMPAGLEGAILESSRDSSEKRRNPSELIPSGNGWPSGRGTWFPLRCGASILVMSFLVGIFSVTFGSNVAARGNEPPTPLHRLVRSRSVLVKAKQFGAGRFVVLAVQNQTDSVLQARVPFGTGLKVQEESVSQIYVLEELELQLVPRGFLVFLFPSTVLDLPFSGLDDEGDAWELFFHHGVAKVLRFVDDNWSEIGHASSASYREVKRDKYDLSRLVLWFIRSVDASQIMDSWMALGDSRGEAEELLARHIPFAERVLKVYLLSRSN